MEARSVEFWQARAAAAEARAEQAEARVKELKLELESSDRCHKEDHAGVTALAQLAFGRSDIGWTDSIRELKARLTALTEAREALTKLEWFDFYPWTPPFRYDAMGSMVVDSKGHLIVDVRGWGFLTGRGHAALSLGEVKAEEIQNALGEHVAKLLNLTSVRHDNATGAHQVSTNSASVSRANDNQSAEKSAVPSPEDCGP